MADTSGQRRGSLVSGLEEHSIARLRLELLAASFAVLFQELALIRWLPGQVRVLAYYPNLVLLAAFLGLGVGCLLAARRSLFVVWPWLLVAVAASAVALSGVIFTQNSASEHLFLLYYDLPRSAPVVDDVRPPIVAFFVMAAVAFVPLGQFVAVRLQEFRRRGRPLAGYVWDLAGSLLGVTLFTALGFTGAFPWLWFAAFLAVGAALVESGRQRLAYTVAALAVLGLVRRGEKAEVYSPYYAISVHHDERLGALDVLTNGSLHQTALPLSRDVALPAEMARVRDGYHLPYRLMAAPPQRALVVGAGTGNDVAVLLDEGAAHVDAVEIDPQILRLGRLHPSHPYDSPRVTAHNTDARSFLNNTRESYDVIVFGTLDSMTRLSALSNVRLDNFVYTVDCLRAARRHLNPGGGIVLYFMAGSPYIDQRLAGMVTAAFGEVPLQSVEFYSLFNRIYMAGPAFDARQGPERRARAAAHLKELAGMELPSDDWPYLYLARRGVSAFYLTLAGLLAALACAAVAAASPAMRAGLSGRGGIDGPMFLFGAGFLLLETRAVTDMGLLWGSTWLTSAVVFGSILAVLLAATLVTAAWRVPAGASMAGLVVSLLVSYALPTERLLGSHVAVKLLLSALFIGAPVFFAGLSFAALFRDADSSDRAFGWNLLGAVFGGLLELLSMALGLKALLLVALAAYLFAALLWLRRPKLAA
jgi:spermidine synthase